MVFLSKNSEAKLNLANISYSPSKWRFLSGRLNWMSYALKPCIKAELLQTDSLLSLLSPQFIHPPASELFAEVKLCRVSSARVSITTISPVSEGLHPSTSARRLTCHISLLTELNTCPNIFNYCQENTEEALPCH